MILRIPIRINQHNLTTNEQVNNALIHHGIDVDKIINIETVHPTFENKLDCELVVVWSK